MASKKPAVSTQLKTALKEIESLTKQLEDEKKYHTSNKQTLEGVRKEKQDVDAELEQMHSLLDSFAGALPRETAEASTEYPYRKIRFNAMTRLASWLASKHNS